MWKDWLEPGMNRGLEALFGHLDEASKADRFDGVGHVTVHRRVK